MRNWTIGEVIGKTFRAYGKSWVALSVGYLIMMAIAAAPVMLWAAVSVIPLVLRGDSPQSLFSEAMIGSGVLAFVGTMLLVILFTPGQARIALAAARGQSPRVAEVFDFRRAGTMFAAAILMGLCVMAGSLLLIVPGIIASLGLQLYAFFVVDTRLSAVDALGASWKATSGYRLHLFGFAIVTGFAFVVAGMIIGIVAAPLQLVFQAVTTPLWSVATATIYEQLRPTEPANDVLALSA